MFLQQKRLLVSCDFVDRKCSISTSFWSLIHCWFSKIILITPGVNSRWGCGLWICSVWSSATQCFTNQCSKRSASQRSRYQAPPQLSYRCAELTVPQEWPSWLLRALLSGSFLCSNKTLRNLIFSKLFSFRKALTTLIFTSPKEPNIFTSRISHFGVTLKRKQFLFPPLP